MKRMIVLSMVAVLTVCLTACGKQSKEREGAQSDVEASGTRTFVTESEGADTEDSVTIERILPEPEYGDIRIRFSWDDTEEKLSREMIVRLIDNEAAENLLSRLPLSLDFEDYRGRQKTGVIPDGLETGNAPGECDCFAGDMNYYEPWDMLTFFYDDFGYAPDLTPLGTIESGLEYLQEIDGGSTVTIELVE